MYPGGWPRKYMSMRDMNKRAGRHTFAIWFMRPAMLRVLAKSVYVCDYLVEFLQGNLQELFLYGESDTQPDYVPGRGTALPTAKGSPR